MQFSVTIVMQMKRCIQNSIFMLIADHVHITYFSGLGCFWCHLYTYCILRWWIKGFNSSITAIMCQVGSYRTVVSSYRMVE